MNKKVMSALSSPTLRNLIGEVNRLGIAKEDIVSLYREEENIILVYYKNAE